MKRLMVLACGFLCLPGMACMDSKDALKMWGGGKTKVKYTRGLFGTSFELENDKDVSIVARGLRVNPETKMIEWDSLEAIDSASARFDAMGRFAPQWGQYVMAPITAYRHTMNEDARAIMNDALASVERLASLWRPYIEAKADSIQRKAAQPPLVDHIIGMLLNGVMPDGMLGAMVSQAPEIGAAVNAAVGDLKQSVNAIDPPMVSPKS